MAGRRQFPQKLDSRAEDNNPTSPTPPQRPRLALGALKNHITTKFDKNPILRNS